MQKYSSTEGLSDSIPSEKFYTNYMVFHELYLSKRLSQKINKIFRFF